MIIKHRKTHDVTENDVTPEGLYLNRRRFLLGTGLAAVGASYALARQQDVVADDLAPLTYQKSAYSSAEAQTPKDAITGYNNYYEYGLSKEEPRLNAQALKTKPWTVEVTGHLDNPGTYDFDQLIDQSLLEERIYRLRCVEAWSMVVPWIGVPLAAIISKLGPTSKAKYVAFETLVDPKTMPGVRSRVLDWPYVEGLRLDEAMNPLTLIATGLYGAEIPKQNGAPMRLVVPWKYGFKSIKSIVRISFVEQQPPTSWNISQPREYGFYSNVNPAVDHPRWSQAKERRIGEFGRRDTLPFNGYAEEVADLYAGMDLRAQF